MGQFVGLTAGRPLLTLAALVVVAVCGVLHVWITHRTRVRHEVEATRRVQLAVDGTNSTDRAAVVRAYAKLEAAAHPASRLRRPPLNQQGPT
jgi:hypothetical protein